MPSEQHHNCRPPAEAIEVRRWSGARWVPDDGKPGLAFSGKMPYKSKGGYDKEYPACWTTECTPACRSTCAQSRALTYTSKRYGAANGHFVA